MNLIYPEYSLSIQFEENKVFVISAEHPEVYSSILRDIWNQVQGEMGGFILSENEKIKNIAKEMDCIFNPFVIDCNDKRILSKLYQELKENIDNFLIQESVELNQYIVNFLDEISKISPYALEYGLDLDIIGLLKIYGVKIESIYETLLERIIEYIKVMSQICNIKIFVFVDLKHYLLEEELKQLYEFVFYEKIVLIIIEPVYTRGIEGEKCWTIDKDLCIIEM